MKYWYSDVMIKEAFERFLFLKNSPEYRTDYKENLKLDKEIRITQKKLLDSTFTKTDLKILKKDLFLKRLRANIFKKWDIGFLVNPHWRIKLEDLLRPKIFQPGDTKSKFLYAFFRGPKIRFVFPEGKSGEIVSKVKSRQDEGMKKMFCWFLMKKSRIKIRALARIFNVTNKTINNWFDEVEELSNSDKNIRIAEIFSGKNMFIKKDALDTHPIQYREDL